MASNWLPARPRSISSRIRVFHFRRGRALISFPQSSRLIVRNTEENLELVDALVEQANVAGPKQVEIEAKFVEITQNNLKELGFDWLLGQFNVGHQGVFGSGGTSGTNLPVNPERLSFCRTQWRPVGQFPVTAGNRSGNLAITANALDALLFGIPGASALAPGFFGLSGVFTDPAIPGCGQGAEPEERRRPAFRTARHDQEWPACRDRDRARVSLPDAV